MNQKSESSAPTCHPIPTALSAPYAPKRPTFDPRSKERIQTGITSIDNLDLSSIKFKLNDVDSSKWNHKELEITEDLYVAFLSLRCKYPDLGFVPTKNVDEFWHQHILDTQKYYDDCMSIFGSILHHYPYSGMGDEVDKNHFEEMKKRTQEIFSKEYPELMISASEYYNVFSWVNDGNNCSHHN